MRTSEAIRLQIRPSRPGASATTVAKPRRVSFLVESDRIAAWSGARGRRPRPTRWASGTTAPEGPSVSRTPRWCAGVQWVRVGLRAAVWRRPWIRARAPGAACTVQGRTLDPRRTRPTRLAARSRGPSVWLHRRGQVTGAAGARPEAPTSARRPQPQRSRWARHRRAGRCPRWGRPQGRRHPGLQ